MKYFLVLLITLCSTYSSCQELYDYSHHMNKKEKIETFATNTFPYDSSFAVKAYFEKGKVKKSNYKVENVI